MLVIDDAYFEYMKDKNYSSGLDIFKNSKNLTSEEIFDEIIQIEYENTNFVRAVNVDQNTLYKGIFQNSNSIISTILWLFILNIISLIYLPILWKFFGLINFNFNGLNVSGRLAGFFRLTNNICLKFISFQFP